VNILKLQVFSRNFAGVRCSTEQGNRNHNTALTQEQNEMGDEDPQAVSRQRKTMLQGTLVVAAGTLFSRLLGMLRDVITANTLGMSVGGTMDAFVLAFRLPDVARRFFGDGTLGISFIPVFGNIWHNDRQKASALLTALLCRFLCYLMVFVLVGEVLCWLGLQFFHPDSKVFLTARLLSLLLPYLILICMAAICSASLHVQGKFFVPTFVPPILNIAWITCFVVIVPMCSSFRGMKIDPDDQSIILAVCILIAGFIQLLIQYPFLKTSGFRFDFDFRKVHKEVRKIFHRFFPQVFGLMTLQLNILVASMLAWLFSGQAGAVIGWLNGMMTYPLRPGAAAAIYYSERLFEFPQGLIGLTIAATIYPLMAHHAAYKKFKAMADDLTLGLRLQFVFAIPAGAGLMLMSEKLAHLLFHRGAFNVCDMTRTADMIFWFSTGIWAFCTLPVIVRAFYILGNTKTPFKATALSACVNVFLGFILMCWMQEQGLAIAVSVTAAIQSAALILRFSCKYKLIHIRELTVSIFRSVLATACMCVATAAVMKSLTGNSSLDDILHISLGSIVGMTVFFLVLRFLGGRELGILAGVKLKKRKH
jgi:putative peptidoglycan lipid II flippase